MLFALVFTLLLLPMISQAADEPDHDQPGVAGFTHSEALRLGERMYREGILPDGKPMQAVVAGDVHMDGRMFSCINCHQRSGLGSVEGSVITWPISGNDLFEPRRRTGAWNSDKTRQGPGAVQRWSLPKQYQAADARPAFNDETLARLLRTGIDSAEHSVLRVMPRYQLDDNDMAVLIHYLKALSATQDPGVDDKVIRFATVVTEGVSERDRDAMLLVLQNHIDVHNTQTRPHLRRAKRGPFYKTEGYGAYRKFELDVWKLQGPEETWKRQLESYYQSKPVFALLGGIGSGSWAPVHQFCEENEIPNIFPVTDLPVISDTDWYTLYFSKGLYQEGEAAARFLRRSKQKNQQIVQVFRSGSRGAEIARGFEKIWQDFGRTGLVNKVLESTDDLSLQWLERNIPKSPATVLLWLDNAEVTDVMQSGIFKDPSDKILFLSTTLLSGEVGSIPQKLRESVFFTHPYSLPDEYGMKIKVLKRWLKIRGIPETNLDIQAKMYFLGWMLPGAIKYMRSEFYRDYFLEGFDMMTEQTYAVAIYPRLSFGTAQRYAAKGCFIAQLTEDKNEKLEMVGDWVVN
jgi:hypothetical protein